MAFLGIQSAGHTLPSKEKVKALGATFLILSAIVGLIYAYYLKGLTLEEIRQCFPYLKSDRPFHASIGESLKIWVTVTLDTIRKYPPYQRMSVLTLLSLGYTLYLIGRRKLDPAFQKKMVTALIFLGICSLFNLHEFLVSGVVYRSQWIEPLLICMFLIIVGTACTYLNPWIRNGVCLALIIMACVSQFRLVQFINRFKVSSQYVQLEKGQVYIGNHSPWLETVMQVTGYLKTHLTERETFFALAYDPLYYFFTGRRSPTRMLAFFEHIKVQPEQEIQIIQDLESQKIHTILLSNRAFMPGEEGMGVLGEDYCPLLAAYITQNFQTAASFGIWDRMPGWYHDHGVKILRRKGSLERPRNQQ